MRLDQVAHGFIAKVDRLDDVRFGQLIGPRFHHHHAIGRSGNHQIQFTLFNFRIGGVDDELVTHQTHAHRRHRPLEGNLGQQGGDRSTRHGQHIRRHVGIEGHGGGHHLDIVAQPIREQRAQGAID